MTVADDPDFLRREAGRLVAMLSRRAGVHHLDAIEDAVQAALLAAVRSWPEQGEPANRSAWLFSAARNHLVGELRRRARQGALAAAHVDPDPASIAEGTVWLAGDVSDDLLRMLFVCCDDALPRESQLVLALKTLCGFDVAQIAARLFMTEANVYKRFGRARTRLRDAWTGAPEPTTEQLAARLPAVRTILYAMFAEGHLSAHPDGALRGELCHEARRLTEVLAEHPLGATPETFALLALMHFHLARLPARDDGSGGLLLLEEQDRSSWDPRAIEDGVAWLARSAAGDVFSRYHAEAGIAAEHCLAPTFRDVRWDRIVACYELLDRVAPSALHTLNRALAVAEWRGAAAGLAVLHGLEPPSWLLGSHMWSAVLADLHRRAGHALLADQYRRAALASAPSEAVRAALERRLGA